MAASEISTQVAEDEKAAMLLEIPVDDLYEASKGPILERIAALEKKNQELREILEWVQTEANKDRRRIAALEKKNSIPSNKTEAHLDALAAHLLKISQHGRTGMTYKETGKVLGVSKTRVWQMRGLIAGDPRLNIVWHPTKKIKIISLKKNNSRRIV